MAKSRKDLPCQHCGRIVRGVAEEKTTAICARCLLSTKPRVPQPKEKPKKDPAPTPPTASAARQLVQLVKSKCTNWHTGDNICLIPTKGNGDACTVAAGGRCGWFERAILTEIEQNPDEHVDAFNAYLAQARPLGLVRDDIDLDATPKKKTRRTRRKRG